jgi:DNA repair photolyase
MSKRETPPPTALSETRHPRRFRRNRYVYAVLSRRSGGVSVGVNLSPARRCNFHCLYCQVDRRGPAPPPGVDLTVLRR